MFVITRLLYVLFVYGQLMSLLYFCLFWFTITIISAHLLKYRHKNISLNTRHPPPAPTESPASETSGSIMDLIVLCSYSRLILHINMAMLLHVLPKTADAQL